MTRERLRAWAKRHGNVIGFGLLTLGVLIGFVQVDRLARNAAETVDNVEAIGQKNSQLICSIGELITASPVAPRPDENPVEFAKRVKAIRQFVHDLRELEDCSPDGPQRPIDPLPPDERGAPFRVRLTPEAREVLREARRGGDASGPPGGGGLPGRPPPPLNEVVEPVCEAVPTLCNVIKTPEP